MAYWCHKILSWFELNLFHYICLLNFWPSLLCSFNVFPYYTLHSVSVYAVVSFWTTWDFWSPIAFCFLHNNEINQWLYQTSTVHTIISIPLYCSMKILFVLSIQCSQARRFMRLETHATLRFITNMDLMFQLIKYFAFSLVPCCL